MVCYARLGPQWKLWLSAWVFSRSSAAYSPHVNHHTIAGLWKLTQKKGQVAQTKASFPMKEFTLFPKDKQMQRSKEREDDIEHEILLMLKEDGSFQQYADDDVPADQVKIPDKLKYHDADDGVFARFFGRIEGQWDLVDGKLILATERPVSEAQDTILEGEVVANLEKSLTDNPVLQHGEVDGGEAKKNGTAAALYDTYLSIPKGEVNVGKFIYPKTHPSFFEQPMFTSTTKGKFELKQVLGTLNAQASKDNEPNLVEKFRAKDFYGKEFLLASRPLGNNGHSKGKMRWSIKYNKFVEDLPPKQTKKRREEEAERVADIRVMQVKFFANNTFATTGGLGESILRGKYHIVGHDRDQLWMQVWRFGFGRSVSGSVYSEGRSLTTEDEKTYWGKIYFQDDEEIVESGGDTDKDAEDDESERTSDRPLVIKGSVIFGCGLEPQPVGRFEMSETSALDGSDEDEEDIEEEDDNIEDFLDWSNAFQ